MAARSRIRLSQVSDAWRDLKGANFVVNVVCFIGTKELLGALALDLNQQVDSVARRSPSVPTSDDTQDLVEYLQKTLDHLR